MLASLGFIFICQNLFIFPGRWRLFISTLWITVKLTTNLNKISFHYFHANKTLNENQLSKKKKFPLPEAGYTQESPADRWVNMETQTTIHIWSAGGSTHIHTEITCKLHKGNLNLQPSD